MPCVIRKSRFALRITDGTAVTPQQWTYPLWGTVNINPGGRTKHRYQNPDGSDATATYGVGEGDDQETTVQITDCYQVEFGGGSGFANLKIIDILNEAGPWSDLVSTSGDEAGCRDAKTLHLDVVRDDGAWWRINHATKQGTLQTDPAGNKINFTWTSGAPFPEFNAAP